MATISVLTHSSIRLNFTSGRVIYFDPYEVSEAYHDADIVFVTHDHFDHFEPESIRKVAGENTVLVAPLSTKGAVESAALFDAEHTVFLEPYEAKEILPEEPYKDKDGAEKVKSSVFCEAIPAYNPKKQFHPRENNWLGYVITVEGLRYYVAGDTDVTPELLSVHTDYALLPCGGKFTMDVEEASSAAAAMDTMYAIPTHYGSVAGDPNAGYLFNLKFVEKRTPALRQILAEQGYSGAVIQNTLTDIDAKRNECMEMYGVDGIMHCQKWYGRFLKGKILRFGRLEYEPLTREQVKKMYPGAEQALGEDEYIINLHIPSNGGPLTKDAVDASLSEAYDELCVKRGLFSSGVMRIICHSWLLFPETRASVSDDSHLASFYDRFMIPVIDEREGFHDGWRLFGKAWGSDKTPVLSDYSHLPEKTSLQRGYKARLMRGEKCGFGFGILTVQK